MGPRAAPGEQEGFTASWVPANKVFSPQVPPPPLVDLLDLPMTGLEVRSLDNWSALVRRPPCGGVDRGMGRGGDK